MRISIALVLIAAQACVGNPYARSYAPSPDKRLSEATPPESQLQVLTSYFPQHDRAQLVRRGYAEVGMSVFDSPVNEVSEEHLHEQAAKVGANAVLLWTMMFRRANRVVASDSSRRSPPIEADTVTWARFTATYFVKYRDPLGFHLGVADDTTVMRLREPWAARITIVVDGSPAAKADLRPGDILLRIDGYPVGRAFDYMEYVERQRGKQIVCVIDRGGQLSKKTVEVLP